MIYIVWHGTCSSDSYIAFASADRKKAEAFRDNQKEREYFQLGELRLDDEEEARVRVELVVNGIEPTIEGSTDNIHVDKSLDEIDASVFSGDFLAGGREEDKMARRVFAGYLARWARELESMENTDWEEDEDDD